MAAYKGQSTQEGTVMGRGWRYEVWVCDTGYERPDQHDGSCGAWKRAGIHWNAKWIGAFEEAALQGHAFVQAVPVENPGWKPYTVFEHINGGGLCVQCWFRHERTHTEHVVDESTGTCAPCLEAQQQRGPLVRMPDGTTEFTCEECRSFMRRWHEQNAYSERRDPNPRLYRTALDVAREDAKGQ
ncbi:hypothetical protein [Streptomyces sp. NPDC045369]|uniref:hypothetical protein n=1 Tax=Streptomyces sp. NPDC045369 TaxID=3155732 RepID=UPI0033E7884A